MSEAEIIIIGAGMVGLALASALSQQGKTVAVIESRLPTLDWDHDSHDARVSALNHASTDFLKRLNVWSDLRAHCISPCERMQVWDSVGGGEIDFDAAEVNQDALAHIVENREIVRALWQQLEKNKNVVLHAPVKPKSVTVDDAVATLHCEKGQNIQAQLIIGADGAQSWLRDQMSVNVQEKPYHHHAVVAVIKTEKAHERSAFQAFLSTGPLGVLPLADPHHVAMVWSTQPTHSEKLIAMPVDDFNRELANALNVRLGHMECLSERVAIPLTMRHAKSYIAKRMLLVGDAAHTIHPLAGQGANLGFMDAACCAQVIQEADQAHRDMGSHRVLRAYERARKGDNALMLLAMRGFKECFASRSPLWITLRSMGLNLTNRFSFVKKCLIRTMNSTETS